MRTGHSVETFSVPAGNSAGPFPPIYGFLQYRGKVVLEIVSGRTRIHPAKGEKTKRWPAAYEPAWWEFNGIAIFDDADRRPKNLFVPSSLMLGRIMIPGPMFDFYAESKWTSWSGNAVLTRFMYQSSTTEITSAEISLLGCGALMRRKR